MCFVGAEPCFCSTQLTITTDVHRCIGSDLVIIRDITELLTPTSSEWVIHYMGVVGLGKLVLPLRSWTNAEGIMKKIDLKDYGPNKHLN